MTDAKTDESVHLIVFVHGLNGSSADFTSMTREIDAIIATKRPAEKIELRCSSCNTAGFGTYDGIEKGGARLAAELTGMVSTNVKQFSIVSHSLGGLFSRYALFLLCADTSSFLHRVQLCDFVTLASPHLGIRRPQTIWSPISAAFQFGASNLPGFRSAHELCLSERRPAGRPLLYLMATEDAYLEPLRKFRRRMCYSNIFHDIQVCYSTGAITGSNPYRKGASLTGSEEFPSITKASIVNGQDAFAHDLERCFRHDAYGHELRAMQTALGNLQWKRFDVIYHGVVAPLKAHEWICGKNAHLGGNLDVPRHLGSILASSGY